ncbi:YoaK family protein [Luteimonas huabeiensis]|uniref:YoaK family protein n=1 Tax=Luteimonas huabeiensis TaxID=1244513 RepID=UPI000463365E|nr:YoaK family protein [Luteimonas huabeiensis]
MTERLPRWVWVGAITLACIAGMVNVVGYLGFEHLAVSHLTGTTSLLGAALVEGDWRSVRHLWAILIAFSLGAMLSGLIVQDSTLRLGRRYGVALALEAVLLAASVPMFVHQQLNGALLAAMACGLQNAMVTTYSGAAVRTTHLSGMFTDLGIGLGHLIRGMPLPLRRLTLSGLIISGFLGGGILGAWLFRAMHYYALLIPAALTGLTGIGYVAYRHWALRRQRRWLGREHGAPHAGAGQDGTGTG